MNVLFFIHLRDCLYIMHSLEIVPLLILFLSHYFLGPCWITSRPWSSEKPAGGITKLLLNGGTQKWKEQSCSFLKKKRANQNPYAFVFRQHIEKIWLHGIKTLELNDLLLNLCLTQKWNTNIRSRRMIPWNPEFTVDLPRMKAKIVWPLWHGKC